MRAASAKVTVIVPNWNGEHLLPTCLDGLRKQTFADFHAIVVDDGSCDSSVRLIRREYPEVQVICRGKQRGFCAAVNSGISASHSQYIALLNNDAIPTPEWLAASISTLDNRPAFVGCTPKILFLDRLDRVNSIGIFLRADGASRDIGYGEHDGMAFSEPREVFGFSGCAVVLDRAVIDDVGLFDEYLIGYAEDLDWTLRARSRGYRFIYEPLAEVHHAMSSSFGSIPKETTFYQSRNSTYVLLKHLPKSFLIKIAPRWLLLECYRILLAARRGLLWPAVAGKVSIIFVWRQLLEARQVETSSRRLSDGEIHQILAEPPIKSVRER